MTTDRTLIETAHLLNMETDDNMQGMKILLFVVGFFKAVEHELAIVVLQCSCGKNTSIADTGFFYF